MPNGPALHLPSSAAASGDGSEDEAGVGARRRTLRFVAPETLPWPAESDPEGRAELEKFKTYMDEGTVRGRLPTLRELADAAVFSASDRASAMTGAIVNLTCGSILD